jgi:cytochrome P450
MPWTLHRHTKLWDRPEAFIPSRFLPENRGTIDRYQYLPFGVGPRICIGATFALQEAVIALGALLSSFALTAPPRPSPGRCRNSPPSPKAACRCG